MALAVRYPSAAEPLEHYAKLVLEPVDEPHAEPALADPHHCPCCGGKPGASALRPEADGARRSLTCAQCAHEWTYQRLLCPHCQEHRFDELPIYIAESYPHLRVEGCNTCKRYLIAADLVKNSEAIPLVEDIAALPLHLWATGQGYTKMEPNLFGF